MQRDQARARVQTQPRVHAQPGVQAQAGAPSHTRGREKAGRRGPAAAADPEPLTGLARRLLREGIVSRDALTEALQGSREQASSLVACLVPTGRGRRRPHRCGGGS